jgi:hydrogenase-4 component B
MFPVHIWLPKAHPVAPAPASALLSGALTKTGVWGILAVSCQLFRGDPAWGTVILALGTVTMLLGAVLALFSVDLKRTLACSSMSQIGFILVGVGMMGILGEENALAARGTVLHMVNHSVFKLVLFLCAGTVFRNLHQLDLNDIRGFGRKKPLLKAAFLLGAMGIGGVPLLNGYVSKTLLHEGIVEGAHLTGSGWLTAVEWIFLFSGGLTAAYMTKLFVAVFVEKHPTRQAEFDGMKRYLSRPAALALGLSALVVPVLGLTADHTMNAVADLASDFLHGEAPAHAVHYLSAENLKGAAISIAIGAAVYGCVVRTGMMRRGVYLNRWPARLDLEDLVYRPLLLRILPGLFGWLCAFFGENRATGLLAKGVQAAGSRLGAIFGENRVTGPAAKGLFAGTRTLSHALSDSLDALVVALQRTVFRQSAERRENKVADTVSYRLGEKLDRAAARLGGERAGRTRYAERLYCIRRTVRETGRQITGNLSFALLMLVLAICAVLACVLLR